MAYKTGDKAFIKEINRSLILKTVREYGPVSRAEVARILGLNPATVSGNVRQLEEEGLIKCLGDGESSGGRKPILIGLSENSFNCIGVDVQKEKVISAVVNLEGTIINTVSLPLVEAIEKDTVLSVIIESIDKAIRESGLSDDRFFGIGVGMHGIVDSTAGVSIYAPAFNWHNVPIADKISKKFNLPVTIDNDARAKALGEKWFGIAKGIDDYVFVHVGTGIGSGIVLNGELYKGRGQAAGEVGHIKVVDDGMRCVCGKFGCLDTVASVKSLIKKIKANINMGYNTRIIDLVNGDLTKISIEIINQAAAEKDVVALSSLEEVGRFLGIAIADVVNILNPQMIVIGGEMALAGNFLLKPLVESAGRFAMDECFKDVSVVLSSLKGDSGALGAASMAISNIFVVPKITSG